MNRQSLAKVVAVAVVFCGTQPPGIRAAFGQTYVTYDIPDATQFFGANAINPAGEVVGDYFDSSDHEHSFFRASDGSLTTFDPPGTSFPLVGTGGSGASGVTPNGAIVGSYLDAAGAIHGYLRASNGAFTVFDAPDSTVTSPAAINPSGEITGRFVPAGSVISRGFVRSPSGVMTTFDAVPDATSTGPIAINPAGATTGSYQLLPGGIQSGFVRAPNGAITTFTVNDMSTQAVAINPAGEIAGSFGGFLPEGFLRTPDGTIITFDVPGSVDTVPVGITASGAIVGSFLTADLFAQDGFVRSPQGDFTAFEVPGSSDTIPTAVNVNGVITGWYVDANSVAHGFIRLPALTAVPEPSTWAMMLAGFSGLGWLAHMRRRKLTPA
jgi:uncharacterized membrane protein